MDQITFIIPNRDNWKYLKLCYESLKKFAPSHFIHILEDVSSKIHDYETSQFIELLKNDKNVKLTHLRKIEEDFSPIGHTELYNIGAFEANTDIVCILHADMIITENFVENLLKHINSKTIVSATRIEPPLHPISKEKIIKDFGIYPDNVNLSLLDEFSLNYQKENKNKTTNGFFAPWCIYKQDYIELGGMDKLFSPYPHEDVDFANRAVLNGFNLIQSWDSLVYHFTCRGHRWTEKVNENHPMFKFYEERSTKNFLRKWRQYPTLNEHSYPNFFHSYNMGLIINHTLVSTITSMEPLFDSIYSDIDSDKFNKYIEQEQPNTLFDLKSKFQNINNKKKEDILIYLNGNKIPFNIFQLIFEFKQYISEDFNNIEIGPLFDYKGIIFYRNNESLTGENYIRQFDPKIK